MTGRRLIATSALRFSSGFMNAARRAAGAPGARPRDAASVAELRPTNCYVYVLGAEDDSPAGKLRTYVGWTSDLQRRLDQHNAGTGARATRGRQWRLLYVERYFTRPDAMSREWHLKRERKFRNALATNCSL